jgi:UDP-glucose 4-epimerase
MYLVTGGNGYIGSHMCRFLVEAEHKVVNLDNLSTSPKKWVYPESINIQGDISDRDLVADIFQQYPIKGIFHFAGKALVGESEKKPFFYYQENVHKGLQFLETITQYFSGPFIFSSTCASFGMPKSEKIPENHPQEPINSYGRSKLLMEGILKDMARTKKLRVCVLRYFNAAGCSPDGLLGENHDPETHLIPNICLNQLNNKNPIPILGDQYPTPDGTCIRDYIHVLDLAKAHYQGFNYVSEHLGFHDFNLGTENGHSVLEVVKNFEQVIGESVKKLIQPARAGDPPRLISDSSKAKNLLNFKIEYSLKESIQHTYEYLKMKRKK